MVGQFMFALFEFLLDVGDLLVSWRFYLVLLLVLALCAGVAVLVPDDTARMAICVPLLALGAIGSFRWEMRYQFCK